MKMKHQYHVSSTVCARKIKKKKELLGLIFFRKLIFIEWDLVAVNDALLQIYKFTKQNYEVCAKNEKYKIGWQDMKFIVCWTF